MSRIVDALRRVTVYGLTYLLGFLGALTLVAILTRLESTAWIPPAIGLLLYGLLRLIPAFKSVVLRLVVLAFFTSGCLGFWFISEPPPASEPNHRLSNYVPILASIGPVLCAVLILLLWEERRELSHWVWRWLLVLCAAGWAVSYFSTFHMATGLPALAHENFRFTNEMALTHRIPHRGLVQIAFFGITTVASVGLAAAGGAKSQVRAIAGLLFPASLALFDEGRFAMEFSEHLGKRSLLLDLGTIVVTLFITLGVVAAFEKPAANAKASVASG